MGALGHYRQRGTRNGNAVNVSRPIPVGGVTLAASPLKLEVPATQCRGTTARRGNGAPPSDRGGPSPSSREVDAVKGMPNRIARFLRGAAPNAYCDGWIAMALAIPQDETRDTLDRLVRAGEAAPVW